MSPMVISPEVREVAAAFIQSVQRHTAQSELSQAAIDAILEQQMWQQYWAQSDAGAVGAQLPLVDDEDDEVR